MCVYLQYLGVMTNDVTSSSFGRQADQGQLLAPYPSSSSSEEFRDYFHHSSGLAKRPYLSSEALARREERRLLFPCPRIVEQNLCHSRTVLAQLFRRVKETEK